MDWSIDRVVTDRWDGVRCDEIEIKTPTFADVLRVVESLDGRTYTLVSLYGSDNSSLCIGGGSGKYVVFASMLGGQLWNLLSHGSDSNGVVLVNAGGQEGDFPVRQVLDKSCVLHAARTFFETGALDIALQWEKQI